MFEFLLSTWIRFACGAVALGWLLSGIGQLNARGYIFLGLPILLLIAIFAQNTRKGPFRLRLVHKIARWWGGRRTLPLLYALMVVLIIAGSVLHEPNNYDGLSYREPKVLFWLEQSRWHWIDSPFGPINYTLPNYEWITVPFFLATGSFHSAVLINWICFLFLPMLFFSLLRAFGTSRHIAYDWMWIFPSAYIVAMLAGGIGNDLLGLTAILAALHFARRFATTERNSFLFDSCLAVGLCTGVKIINVPLAGFSLIFLLKNPRLLRSHAAAFALAALLGASVSALIPMLLNLIHSGTVLGTTTSPDRTTNFAAVLAGNGLTILASCIAPPLFPGSREISATIEQSLGSVAAWIHSAYPKFTLRLNELPQEESSGLGLGITVALIVSAIYYFKYRQPRPSPAGDLSRAQRLAWYGWLVFGLVILLGRLGTGPALPRNLLPWFPLILAPILAAIGLGPIVRTTLWRVAAPIITLSVFPALLITPSRPLIPPATLLALGKRFHVPSSTLEHMSVVYDVYADRADPFGQIKLALPSDARVVGLVCHGDEPTASWLKPYGARRWIYLTSQAKLDAARKTGVQYVIVEAEACHNYFNMDTEDWLKLQHAETVVTRYIRIYAARPPWRYTLARFEPGAKPNENADAP